MTNNLLQPIPPYYEDIRANIDDANNDEHQLLFRRNDHGGYDVFEDEGTSQQPTSDVGTDSFPNNYNRMDLPKYGRPFCVIFKVLLFKNSRENIEYYRSRSYLGIFIF